MKKLTSKEMKGLQGGAPPLCVQVCNYMRNFCINQGNSSAYCEDQWVACVERECNETI